MSGLAPTVSAGPNKSISLPAKDLTLFGHATDPESDPLIIQWTQTSGPATAVFSAPWALVTTVTFTAAGTYTFQLSANDGTSIVTSTVTVTVHTAASQTAFYVDPDYTGGTRVGSSSQPWHSLIDTVSNTPWDQINSALASADVIVYHSARKASSDVAQTSTIAVALNRTNLTANRLTLDGMSKYNTNAVTPSWSDYTGTAKFTISADYCFNTNNDSDLVFTPRPSITIRGFKTVGQSGAHLFLANVSHFVYELSEHTATSGVSAIGPGVIVAHRPRNDPVSANYGTDITIRGNYVHDTLGEGIYIGGSTPDPPGNGNLQTNVDVLIESNTITNPGSARSAAGTFQQGDGIDIKDGNVGLVVRGNAITYTTFIDEENQGIVAESGALFEQNYIEAPPQAAIKLAPAWSTNGVGRDGIVIRNNVLVASKGMTGLYLAGLVDQTLTWRNAKVYNNTILMRTDNPAFNFAVSIGLCANVTFRNNIIAALNSSIDVLFNVSATTFVTHANNLYWRNGLTNLLVDNEPGSHFYSSTTLSTWEPTAVYGDPQFVAGLAPFNLRPQATSPAIGSGANLASTGFDNDLIGTARSLSAGWDIGAYATTGVVTTTVTTASLTASAITSPNDATVTVTVAASPSTAGTPSGAVDLIVDGVALPTRTLLNGSTIYTVSGLLVGTHSLVASYAAQNGFLASTASGTVTVNSATTVAISAPTVFSPSATSVVVTVTADSGTATGSVLLSVDGGVAVSQVLSSGATTFSVAGLTVGTHSLLATYVPTGLFAASTAVGTAVVSGTSTTATGIVASSVVFPANASVVVTVTSDTGTPTGNVTLSVDGGTPTTQALSSGTTTYTLTGLTAGIHVLVATYAAQGGFAASTLASTVTVTRALTTTTVTAPNAVSPANVLVTVTVASTATPTGTVLLSVDGGAAQTLTLSSGVATTTLTAPAVGAHTLAASYLTQSGFAASAGSGAFSVASTNVVTVAWSAVANATSYTVYRASGNCGNTGLTFSKLASTTALTYVDTHVDTTKTYCYHVIATDGAGFSNSVSAAVTFGSAPANTVLATPTNLTAT